MADAQALADAIADIAGQYLGAEGARVVRAILQVEGGLTGAIGDTDRSAVGSHGPFQFFGPGGQLDNFARYLGVSLEEAGRYAREHPLEAAAWALDPANYLGATIKRGLELGLRGPDLATFAQREGQRSERPERAGQAYQQLFGEGGGRVEDLQTQRFGGATAAQPESGNMTLEEFEQRLGELGRQHGRVISTIPLNPTVAATREVPDPERPGQTITVEVPGMTTPNPDPTYRYLFEDGTYVDARGIGQGTGRAQEIEVIGGTALRTSATGQQGMTQVSAPSNAPYIGFKDPQGTITWQPNPNYQPEGAGRASLPAISTTARLLPVYDEQGNVQWLPNPNYTPENPQAEPPPTKQFPDGSLRQWNPETRQWEVVGEPAPKAPAAPETRLFPDGSLRQFNPETQQWEVIGEPEPGKPSPLTAPTNAPNLVFQGPGGEIITRPNPNYLPGGDQAQILRQLQESGELVASMLERGELDVAEAQRYMELFTQQAEAALRGTTPFEQAKQAQEERRLRASIGRDLLNQRVSSGSGLAQSLIQAAFGALANVHTGLPEDFRFTPLASAQQFVSDAGGGQEVGDLARSLIMALAQQDEGAAGPSPGGLPRIDVITPAAAAELAQAAIGAQPAEPAAPARPAPSLEPFAARNLVTRPLARAGPSLEPFIERNLVTRPIVTAR